MKFIDELELKGKRVFIRSDIDVPLNDSLEITDDHRILSALPTIKYAVKHGAKVIIAGHLGRPKGEVVEALSAKPVATRLSELLDTKVTFANNCTGDEVVAQSKALKESEVLVIENVRFHPGEQSNDLKFAEDLSKLADVYINNAFATSHRAHASTAGIANFVKEKAAGLTIKNELEYFERALKEPKRPLGVIFGGAKISTKIKAIENVAKGADFILLGGAMANTFFKAAGHNVGKSLYEEEQLQLASETIAQCEKVNCKLITPVDVIVSEKFEAGSDTQVRNIDEIKDNEMALDIGPKSIELFTSHLAKAETIVWNGPMGVFEMEDFSKGTFAMVDALIESKGLTVVGGGDTDLALHQKHAMDKVSYASTGGGAFLTLLEGSPLPAVEALKA